MRLGWGFGPTALLFLLAVLSARPAQAQNGIRICGDKLIKILSRLCRNCYAGGSDLSIASTKRSAGSEFAHRVGPYAREESRWASPSEVAELAALGLAADGAEHPPDSSASLHHLFKREGGGIANRCCKRKCTYTYLKRYCCKRDEEE